MNRTLSTLLSLALVFAFASGDLNAKPAKKLPKDFKLIGLVKGSLGAKNLSGKIVVLDFWASWCESCGATMEEVHEVVKGVKGVRYVSASVDETMDEAKEWFDEQKKSVKKLKKYAYLDVDSKLATKLKVKALPAVFVIGKDGTVLFSTSGRPTKKERKKIKSLITKK